MRLYHIILFFAILYFKNDEIYGQVEFNPRKELNLGVDSKSAPPSKIPLPAPSKEKLLLNYKPTKPKEDEGDIGLLPNPRMKSAKDLIEAQMSENGQLNSETFMRNQNFGNISTESSSVNILCRDHENIDGDMIAIYVNDKIVVPRMVLEGSFTGYKVHLNNGFNKIDFIALNEGYFAPNTAEFEVYDDRNVVLFSERWVLAKGFKATVLVIKQ